MNTSILPDDSFSVFPIEERINAIDGYITRFSISEENQRAIVNITYSINTPDHCQQFLDYLLKTKPGSADINFKLLYDRLDDARQERYAIANWFVDQQTNRKHFIYAVYNLWKLTNYNTYYIPTGVTPNESDLNPNAYFLNEGLEYYIKYNNAGQVVRETNAILEFESYYSSSNGIGNFNNKKIKFQPKEQLEQEKIIINKVEQNTSGVIVPGGYMSSGGVYDYNSDTITTPFGKYHMYQPLVLVGYKADLELEIPNSTPIPAFLFYYADEFDKIKDFDATMNFLAEVTLEVVLFFALGGLGALRHLKHLKHANKIGAAFRNTLAADEAVVVWRGLSAGTEVLSLNAGLIYSTTQLIANSTNDQATHDTYKALGTFFLVLTFASAGGSIYSARRAAKSADEVLKKVDELSDNNISHGIHNDVLDILYTIRNTATVSKTFFRNRIASLTDIGLGGESNHIIGLFDAMTDAQKNQFWQHFGNRVGDANANSSAWGQADLDFWGLMNKTESGVNVASVSAARMQAWIDAPPSFRHLIRDIKHLDEVIHLSIKDREAFNHLAFFANRPRTGTASNSFNITGGHTYNLVFDGTNGTDIFISPGIEILDPNFAHVINPGNTSQKMIDYIANTQNNTSIATILSNGNLKVYKYTKEITPSNHILHRQILIKKQGAPVIDMDAQFVLNGVVYAKPKVMHTQINPNWSELDIIHQYAHALRNKSEIISEFKYNLSGNHGTTNPWFERFYKSELLDGTEVIIKHANYHRYNLQPTFDNHYPYFELKL